MSGRHCRPARDPARRGFIGLRGLLPRRQRLRPLGPEGGSPGARLPGPRHGADPILRREPGRFVWLQALAAACLLWNGAPAQAGEGRPVKLFLLAGQSDMEGCGKSSELPEAYRTPPAHVTLWDNRDGAWVELGKDSTAVARQGLFGPEVAFAHHLAAAYPRHTIALVKCAAGGTRLHTHGVPGKGMYRRFIGHRLKVVDDLDQPDAAYEIAGMLRRKASRLSAANVVAPERLVVAQI